MIREFFCWHQWITISYCDLTKVNSSITGTRYTLRCQKCGWVKKRDLI